MLRYLLFLLSFTAVWSAHAQHENAASKTNEKQDETQIDYKQPGSPMPPFRLIVCRDSAIPKAKDVLTNKDLDNGANLFVMIFNPTCSHCEDETAMLEKNLDLFRRSKLVLSATPMMKPYVSDFLKLLHIKDYPAITVGIDSADYMNKVFLYQSLPQINIYDSRRKLVRIYSGEVSIDSLKQFIE